MHLVWDMPMILFGFEFICQLSPQKECPTEGVSIWRRWDPPCVEVFTSVLYGVCIGLQLRNRACSVVLLSFWAQMNECCLHSSLSFCPLSGAIYFQEALRNLQANSNQNTLYHQEAYYSYLWLFHLHLWYWGNDFTWMQKKPSFAIGCSWWRITSKANNII